MNIHKPYRYSKFWPGILFVFVVAIAVYRIFICIDFNLEYYDSDQFIMWLSARNFSQGLFYGPCFYGQDYNFMIEGLIAAPLVYLGVDVRMAVALATHVLCSLFWFGNTWILVRHKAYAAAIMVLCVWMLVPLEYDLLTALPRGFIPGFACCCLMVWTLQRPNDNRAFNLNCMLASIAFIINATTLWLTLPVLVFAIIHTRSRTYALFATSALAIAILILKLLSMYYIAHPEMVVHARIDDWSWAYFKKNILRLGQLIYLIGPVCKGWGLFWIGLILIFIIYNKNKFSMYFTVFILIAVFLFFLFHIKVGDGKYNWVFFSNSRFFIGIPLVLAMFYTQLKDKAMHVLIWPMIFIGAANVGFKIHHLKNKLETRLQITTWFGVHVFKKTQIEEALHDIKHITQKHKVQTIIISANQWQDELIAYAGPALYPGFTATRITHAFGGHADRRYWLKKQHAISTSQNLLYISSNFNLTKPHILNENQWQKINDYGFYTIIHSNLSINQWVSKLDSLEHNQALLLK